MATKQEWDQRWSSLSDAGLLAVALIRMVECANGTIQYAFRGKDQRALDVDKTREAMALSMGIIKTKKLPDGTELPEEIHDIMNDMRRLYIDGFKNQNEEAFNEFMMASVANVEAMGKERLDVAERYVRENFTEIFTEDYITYGRYYLDNLAA